MRSFRKTWGRIHSWIAAMALLLAIPAVLGAQTSVTVDDQSLTVVDGVRADLVAGADGYYVALRSDDFIVTVHRLDASGAPTGAPVGVIDLTPHPGEVPSRALHLLRTADRVAVAWTNRPGGTIFPDAEGVWSRLYDASGPAGDPIELETSLRPEVGISDWGFSNAEGSFFFNPYVAFPSGHDIFFSQVPVFFSPEGEPLTRPSVNFIRSAIPLAGGFLLYASDYLTSADLRIVDAQGEIIERFDAPEADESPRDITRNPLGDYWAWTAVQNAEGSAGWEWRHHTYELRATTVGPPVSFTDPPTVRPWLTTPVPTPDGGLLFHWYHRHPVTEEEELYLRHVRADGVTEDSSLAGDGTLVLRSRSVGDDGRFLLLDESVDGEIRVRRGWLDRSWTVDGFAVDQAALALSAPGDVGSSTTGFIDGVDQVGGQREVRVELTGGVSGEASMEVVGGQLEHRQGDGVTARTTLVWDQRDGDPAVLDSNGLRGLDLTSGGTRDAVAIDIASAGAGASLTLKLHDEVGDSTYEVALPTGAMDALAVIPFSAFTGAVEAANAGAVSLVIDGDSAPGVDVTLRSIETTARVVTTLGASGPEGSDASPGDVLEYVLEIENPADLVGEAAQTVVYTDDSPLGEQLLCVGADAPTASQGTVDRCDPAAGGGLTVDIGDLADGATATVTFKTLVLPSASRLLCRTGRISSSTLTDALSDDPSTAVRGDGTCTAVQPPADVTVSTSSMLAVDVGNDGVLHPGDTLEFQVVVSNAAGTRPAESLVLTNSSPDAALVAGSVVTSQGTVTSGNEAGDDRLEVALGSLASSGQATVTFRLQVDFPSAYVPGVQSFTLAEGPGIWVRDAHQSAPVDAGNGVRIELRDVFEHDADGDGLADRGDRVRYDVAVIKDGARDHDAQLIRLRIPDWTSLVADSITTTRGEVVQISGGRVTVDFGAPLVGTDRIDLSYVVEVGVAQGGVEDLVNQAVTSEFEFTHSDDPDTPQPDPTLTALDNPTIFYDGFESGRTLAWDSEFP
ncbi:MAG: hypothetical protein AAGM22_18765 [Acidobacteriota bacterium]